MIGTGVVGLRYRTDALPIRGPFHILRQSYFGTSALTERHDHGLIAEEFRARFPGRADLLYALSVSGRSQRGPISE